MDFVILDLEWSAAYSRKNKKFINEIIEFGAVKLNSRLEQIGEFAMLITPQLSKKLNPYVRRLTHLSMEELNNAHNTFAHALGKFAKFAADCVLMTWSTSDIIALKDNREYFSPGLSLDFLQYYCNVQPYCEVMLDKRESAKQLALSACCELVEVEYDENRRHRAIEDARLTAECLRKLYDPELLNKFIMKADAEFYKRLAFRTHYVTNTKMHNRQVKKLSFLCPHCSASLAPESKWITKGHSFCAPFFCSECQKKLLGTVTYKATYDGIIPKFRMTDVCELNSSENEPASDENSTSKKAPMPSTADK